MTDIVPSEELLAFMHRFYAAWQVWDFDTMNEMISAKPQLLIIGTDSAEWWNGRDALDIWMLQAKETGSITIRSSALTAFSCGSVGWIADQLAITVHGAEVLIGMRVTAVASAGEALAEIEREVPDMIVSDLAMPDVDGYQLIQRIRALPGARGRMPAIALTAFARPEDRVRVMRAGFQNHVAKPLDPAELFAVLVAFAA